MTRIPTTVVPPPGLFRKFRFYSAKYGAANAAARWLGRWSPRFWNAFGVTVTASTRKRWLAGPGPRILNLGGGSHCLDEVWLDSHADRFQHPPEMSQYLEISVPGAG
jgi:hypothetical protein